MTSTIMPIDDMLTSLLAETQSQYQRARTTMLLHLVVWLVVVTTFALFLFVGHRDPVRCAVAVTAVQVLQLLFLSRHLPRYQRVSYVVKHLRNMPSNMGLSTRTLHALTTLQASGMTGSRVRVWIDTLAEAYERTRPQFNAGART